MRFVKHVVRAVAVVILFLAMAGCDDPEGRTVTNPATPPATAPAGMNQYPYLAADGGPHVLLPSGVAGVDYARACAATANVQMAVMPAGPTSASAIVFADPPMTAWGTSSDGLVEVYYLAAWTGMNLDGLVATATAALPTASLTDTGAVFRLTEPDAFLLFAGDMPASSAYGVHRVPMPAGTYNVLTGTYTAGGQSVTIYRLKPLGNS